jgi:ribosomal protein L40E
MAEKTKGTHSTKGRARGILPPEMETAESKARRVGTFTCWKCAARNYTFRETCWKCGEKKQ